jgi:hypothetical protein
MSHNLQPIAKLNSREPKMSGGGMPDRNKETRSPTANCNATIPSGNNVKATVDKVLNKIK